MAGYSQTAGNAGLVRTSRARSTNALVSAYRSAEAGIEDDPSLPYATVCEDHGTAVCHETRSLALYWLASPETWCGDCQRLLLRTTTPRRLT